MKSKPFLIIAATFLVLAVVMVYHQTDQSVISSTVNDLETIDSKTFTTHHMLQQEQLRNSSAKHTATYQQVSSLQDTMPDGAVNLDEHGDVVADKDLHRYFDYYLSATGEMTADEIRTRMLSVASDFLSLDQLEQLRDLFDQYVNYLSTAERFALSQSDDTDITERLHAISELRQEALGPKVADAFFADEEAYARHVLSMQGLAMSDVTEAQQLKWLAVEEMATEFHDVLIENNAFNDLQITEAERMIVRTDRYGETVAQNLAALDVKQAAWQDKVNQYIDLRHQLAGNSDLLQDLEQNYDPRELKRLRAYYQVRRQN